MTHIPSLVPATELAARNRMRFPNESGDYRRARTALLAEEIELRRHIERVYFAGTAATRPRSTCSLAPPMTANRQPHELAPILARRQPRGDAIHLRNGRSP